jgi:hypothetical protein
MSVNKTTLQVFPVQGDTTPYYVAMQPQTKGFTSAEYVSTTCTFIPQTGVLNATATSARYADLAEVFEADTDYIAGTVVIFGGEKEIATTDISHDARVAGVVSTNPAYLMNDQAAGLAVALTGRVPCQVQGPVDKGTVLVTSNTPGVAQAIDLSRYTPGCVLGKSLESIEDTQVRTIEVVVGRF